MKAVDADSIEECQKICDDFPWNPVSKFACGNIIYCDKPYGEEMTDFPKAKCQLYRGDLRGNEQLTDGCWKFCDTTGRSRGELANCYSNYI